MRQQTVTEKYRLVQEGKLAKGEFVRQMRLGYPQHITQYNGYDDSVQILKNRGLLFVEAKKKDKKKEVYNDSVSTPYSLDALERGIRYELQGAGLMTYNNIKAEDFVKAEQKAKENLQKDPNHYLNLIAGESKKVDKHDREEEVKRGEGKVDVYNAMKKADLKEAKEMLKEGRLEDLAKKLGVDVDKLKKAADKIRDMERDQAQKDALKLAKMKEVIDEEEVEEEVEVVEETPILKEVIASAIGKIKEKYNTIFPSNIDSLIKAFIKKHYKEVMDGADPVAAFEKYIGDTYNESFNTDYVDEGAKEMDDVYGDGDVVVDISGMSPGMKAVWEIEKEISEFGDSEDAQMVVDDMIEINSEEHLVSYLKERGIDTQTIVNMVKAYNSASVSEKKGKDHDGDGDVDSDDYMAAKDKAIKKAMGKDEQLKEAIKSIIKKTLKDEIITEAATNELSKLSDTYGGFKGMPLILNDLENLVTDVESFYARTQDKLQGIFNKVEQVENEEGLKVGGFLAPAIETAFVKDLRPVQRKGFMSGVEIPKVKFMPKDIETPQNEAPKQTVFGVNEDKE